MKPAVIAAIVSLVVVLAAFNFARFSSLERQSGERVGRAPGPGTAGESLAPTDGDAPAAGPDLEGMRRPDAVPAAAGAADLEIRTPGAPADDDASSSRASGTSANGGAAGLAPASRERGEWPRRSRWYRRPEPDLSSWTRPEGPPRVALQAGHWKAREAPDEQAGLRDNGARGGGKAEWEVNLAIARKTAALLERQGLTVDILPTTITPGYWADVFVSIHADGNVNGSVSGYRAAAPRRDRTGRADELASLLTRTYGEATGLPHYPTITRRMSSYYAFNYRRYEHALHPMTVGVILETGFLTSPRDRRIIIDAPDRAARGIADAVVQFLNPPPGS